MNLAAATQRITLAALLLSPAIYAAPQEDENPREIGRTTERELKITLSSTLGSIHISRGEPEKIAVITSGEKDGTKPHVTVDYAVRNRVGYLDITLGKDEGEHSGIHIRGGDWYITLTDAIPISFDLELDVVKGDFDLTGLKVKDFNLSAGASDVTLTFDQQNTTPVDNINIESGVSKFDGRMLCNANFRHFRFQGGVGASTLDFGGTLTREVDVDLEVGLGVMNVIVPSQVGARVFYSKNFLSKLQCDSDFEPSGQDQYTTTNFFGVPGRMNIRIDTGLGSIKVRRE